MGCPAALSHDQADQCRRMAGEGADLRHIAPVVNCSPATVKKVLGSGGKWAVDPTHNVHWPEMPASEGEKENLGSLTTLIF